MEKLQEKYNKEGVPAMMKKFGYKNPMAVPRITKITLIAHLENRCRQNFWRTG
jgi:ribosomal protein L5